MRQMGIKAQWVKPYIQTTIDSDFSQNLKNVLNEEFNPTHPGNDFSRIQIYDTGKIQRMLLKC